MKAIDIKIELKTYPYLIAISKFVRLRMGMIFDNDETIWKRFVTTKIPKEKLIRPYIILFSSLLVITVLKKLTVTARRGRAKLNDK